MNAYQVLIDAVNQLHDQLINPPYTVQDDGITMPFGKLKTAQHYAAMRSRLGVTITGLFKGRKCLALYQAGKRI